MLPKREDLSPALEWMLQSDQVADDTLIEALVQRYYQQIYQQALSQLTYPEEARRTAQETFVQTVIESHKYRGTMPVDEWLDEIASRLRDEREPFLQEQLLLNLNLIRSINKLNKRDQSSPQDLELAMQAIKTEVDARKKSGSKQITVQVLGLLGVIALVVVIMLGSRNYWSPQPISENPPAQIDSGEEQHAEIAIADQQESAQDILVETSEPTEPLTLNSTSDEIRERILSSTQYWDTMWAEVIVTFHGPGSYKGPPEQERHQYWIDPKRGGMLVSGPLDGFPNFVERFDLPASMDDGDRIMSSEIYAQIGSIVPWFILNFETVLELPFALNYMAGSTFSQGWEFIRYSPVGEIPWAVHQALIFDLITDSGITIGQVYLEPETGIALREQFYEPGSNRNTIIESSLIDLKFNQPMPNLWKGPDSALRSKPLFLPGSNIDTDEFNSEPASMPFARSSAGIAPLNIDASLSKLSFYSSSSPDESEDGFTTYGIFADDLYLGEIDLINPLEMICDRSPSGKRIAFATWRYFQDEEIGDIFWFDLDELQLSSHQLPDMALHWIGFSPDERWLAMSGFSETDGTNQFFLLNTDAGTIQSLPIQASFNRIAWSSDGSQIMVLEESPPSFDSDAERNINIYSVVDGQLVDQIEVKDVPYDLNNLRIPFKGGEIEFKLGVQDISSCAAPPRN